MRGIANISVITALVLSLGLHWALLQTVAWTGMIVSYSRDATFSGAVAKTFDGQHPCCLCKAIQKGKASERERDEKQVVSKDKLDLGLVWDQPMFVFDSGASPAFSPVLSSPSRVESPLRPPPRLV